MPVYANRVLVTTVTTGTGTVTLGSAISGYQDFAAGGVANGNTVSYVIEDAGNAWEIGTGTYSSTGPTLTRTLVQSSTGALLNLSGNARVYVVQSAADMATLSLADGTAALPSVAFYSDPDTGLSRPAANTLAFSTGGTEKMRLTNAGGLGIGTVFMPTSSTRSDLIIGGSKAGMLTLRDATETDIVYFLADTGGVTTVETTGQGDFNLKVSGGYNFAVSTAGTERLRVTSAGDVGIGTTSPGYKLDVSGPARASGLTLNGFVAGTAGGNLEIGWDGTQSVVQGYNRTSAAYVPLWLESSYTRFGINGTERMRIDSAGNLGLGVVPSAWGSPYKAIQVNGGASLMGISNASWLVGNMYYDGTNWRYVSSASASIFTQASDGNNIWYGAASGTAGGIATLVERMRLDASGNLGLGVTPSAWGASGKVLQITGNTALYSNNGASVLGNNFFYNGTNNLYYSSSYATLYSQTATGQHQWFTAPSGTAGNAITFTQAMTLDASGNLGIGTTAPTLNATGTFTHINASGTNAAAVHLTNGTTGAAAADGMILARWNDNTNYLWVYENEPLAFGTNSTERARIHASGGVSIGNTTDPGAGNLRVNGSLALGSGATVGGVPMYGLKGRVAITASQTYTPSSNVRAIIVQLWGKGGAGGSTTTTTSDNGSGGGGGAGGYSESFITSLAASYTVTIGATAGSTSSFVGTGITMSVTGGSNGANGGNLIAGAGGAGGTASGGNVINIAGQGGGKAATAANAGLSGGGGNAPIYGIGGEVTGGNVAGPAGSGYGAGGSGGTRITAGTAAGGAGAAAACVIWEYF